MIVPIVVRIENYRISRATMIASKRLPASFMVNPVPCELLWQQELLQYAEDLKKEMSEPQTALLQGFRFSKFASGFRVQS